MTVAELAKELKTTTEEIQKIVKSSLPENFTQKNFRIKEPFDTTIVTPSGAKAVMERIGTARETATTNTGDVASKEAPVPKETPAPASEKPKRKRRTKAEMEAARAKEDQEKKETPGSKKPEPAGKPDTPLSKPAHPQKAATPKKRVSAKNEVNIKVEKTTPFLAETTLKNMLPVTNCRKILLKELKVSADTLALMADEGVKDMIAIKFVATLDPDNTLHLYRKDAI